MASSSGTSIICFICVLQTLWCRAAYAQQAVKLYGFTATATTLSPSDTQFDRDDDWLKCPIPHLLGIPLMLKQLYPDDIAKRSHDERPATYLMADPVSGLAPNWVRVDRLGEVLLARSDGQEFTRTDFWELHDYMSELMDLYSRWEEMRYDGRDPKLLAAARTAALTPAAYQRFTEDRRWEKEQYKTAQKEL